MALSRPLIHFVLLRSMCQLTSPLLFEPHFFSAAVFVKGWRGRLEVGGGSDALFIEIRCCYAGVEQRPAEGNGERQEMENVMSTPPTGPQHMSLSRPNCQFAKHEACVRPYLFASDGLPTSRASGTARRPCVTSLPALSPPPLPKQPASH